MPLEERQADQVDIDENILDYLVYKALKTLLRDFQKSIHNEGWNAMRTTWKAHIRLNLVDSFLSIYKASHPNHHSHENLQFRIRLLRFAALFTLRWSPRQRRHVNLASSTLRDRIDQERIPLSPGSNAQNESRKPLPSVSLLDTLPSFMALSAAANAMQKSKITDTWMRLAAGYMAHAVVEQHVTFECRDDGILQKAFDWGFDPHSLAREGSDDWAVNAMFLDEEEEFISWKAITNEHMQALIPPNLTDTSFHLRSLQENELSFPAFNNTIVQFLKGLSQSLPKPLLLSKDSTKKQDPQNN